MENKEIKRTSRIGLYLTIFGFVIIFGTFVGFFYNQNHLEIYQDKLEKQVETYFTKTTVLTDSVRVLETKIDSIDNNARVLSVVSDYIRFRNFHQIDSVMFLVADTPEKFYILDAAKLNKTDIQKDFEQYWKTKPNSRYFLDPENISIKKIDGNNYEARLSSYFTLDGKTIKKVESIIRVDANNKIYFTKDISVVVENP